MVNSEHLHRVADCIAIEHVGNKPILFDMNVICVDIVDLSTGICNTHACVAGYAALLERYESGGDPEEEEEEEDKTDLPEPDQPGEIPAKVEGDEGEHEDDDSSEDEDADGEDHGEEENDGVEGEDEGDAEESEGETTDRNKELSYA